MNFDPRQHYGIIIITDRKEAQNTAFEFVYNTQEPLRDHMGIWNGDVDNHRLAHHPSNVTMCALAVFHIHDYLFKFMPSLKVFV